MQRVLLSIVLGLLPAGLLAAEGENAGDSRRVLSGTYTSAFNDRPERVRAIFVPTGEPERWEVTFDFSFNRRQRSWYGSAEGGFDAAGITGMVRNEAHTRLFTFRLEQDRNRFKGTHFEVVRGKERKTGTLTLKG